MEFVSEDSDNFSVACLTCVVLEVVVIILATIIIVSVILCQPVTLQSFSFYAEVFLGKFVP
jgi:hypothetical protein